MKNRGPNRNHQIRTLKTNTGVNHSITISKKTAQKFSGCSLFETVLSDGILLISGASHLVVKDIKVPHLKNFQVIE